MAGRLSASAIGLQTPLSKPLHLLDPEVINFFTASL